MTVDEIAQKVGLRVVFAAEDREATGVFCGDLLSVVMSRAQAGCAWVTVIGNVNAVAVAQLADLPCIVICEGFSFDAAAVEAAKNTVTLLASDRPVYETAAAIGALLL